MSPSAIKLGPKPKRWDFVAVLVLLAGVVLCGANWAFAERLQPGSSLAGGVTFAFATAQMAVACLSLLVLGKTAKLGTLWGNLASVGGMFVGVSGVLLAAAMSIAA